MLAVVGNAGFGMKGDHAANDPQAMTDMLMVNCNAPMQLAQRISRSCCLCRAAMR